MREGAGPGAPYRTEICLHEVVDRLVGRRRLGQLVLAEAAMSGRVHVDPRTARLEHLANSGRHALALHPVEGLRERHDPERAKVAG